MTEDERITLICDRCARTKTVRKVDWEENKNAFKIFICDNPVIPRSLKTARAERNRKCNGTLSEHGIPTHTS